MVLITMGLIYWDVFISIVGMGIFLYGKKRPCALSIITGIVLMIYPYFVGSIGWSVFGGLAITAVYFFLKLVVRM